MDQAGAKPASWVYATQPSQVHVCLQICGAFGNSWQLQELLRLMLLPQSSALCPGISHLPRSHYLRCRSYLHSFPTL